MKETYQKMNTQIQPDEKLIQEIMNKSVRKIHPVRKTVAVLVACAVLSMTSISLLAHGSEEFNDVLYEISPQAGALFSPVMQSDIQNGIEMAVEGVYIHDDDAEFYITFQDLEGERITQAVDLMDSYSIVRPFGFDSSSFGCVREDYDEQTGKIRFHVMTHEPGAGKFWGDSRTFFVREIMTGMEIQRHIPVKIDWEQVNIHPETVPGAEFFQTRGYGASAKYEIPDPEQVTIIKPEYEKEFVQEIKLTGLAWENGMLHIQNYIEDWNQNSTIVYYLEDENGEQLEEAYSFGWSEGTGRYLEYFFAIEFEELKKYQVYADYRVGGEIIEGNWKVKFPIVQNE